MWKRSEIKRRAKAACKQNYWKTVLVGFLAALLLRSGFAVMGIGSGASGGAAASSAASQQVDSASMSTTVTTSYGTGGQVVTNKMSLSEALDALGIDLTSLGITDDQFVMGLFALLAVVFLLVFVSAILIDVFVINPVEVGICRFFSENLNEPADASEVLYAFDNDYRRICGIMFKRDLKLVLWTLLLVIPGIIKTYEYRMVPYLAAEHPELSSKEVFAQSKRLMMGSKWRAFVLELSFIGWDILNLLTLGLLGIFKVNGYRHQTNAALYEALCGSQIDFSAAASPHHGGGSHFSSPAE